MTLAAGPAGTIDEIRADLRRMRGRPFGRDEHGGPITGGVGRNGFSAGYQVRPVLVVEDDAGTRDLVRHAPESNGYGRRARANGKKGLEVVAATRRPRSSSTDEQLRRVAGWPERPPGSDKTGPRIGSRTGSRG